jgi:hypothetical protein
MDDLKRIEELETELKLLKKKVIKPQTRYIQQKCQADQRNIEWLFTFESWWKMWEESGKWNERGRKTGQYCMARKGDIGPYSPDNVDIILVTRNSSDAHKNGRISYSGRVLSAEHKEKLREANIGKPQSDETRLKKSLANKGKPWSAARRAAHKQPWNKGLVGVKKLHKE